MKKLISILIMLLITASIFILPMSVSAKDKDVITLRISNCEEYIDEGNWDKDDTIDLDSGDITVKILWLLILKIGIIKPMEKG